jgi:predicted TIM-barrel fold metal-dependent hydrolase
MPTASILISADSHVMEAPDFWAKELPAKFRDRAPVYAADAVTPFQGREGGSNPRARLKEMAVDGVSAEMLYATLGLYQFGFRDRALQEACFRLFNGWLEEFCKVAPERLFGIGMVSCYDIDSAIQELRRCKKMGLRGVMIWQVPPAELSFATDHYERFWAEAQALEMPINLHILCGVHYSPQVEIDVGRSAVKNIRAWVNEKLLHVNNAISDLVFSGVLERYPRLKIVLVENEVSWLPFVLTQWDRYYEKNYETPIKMKPSKYFERQIYATFFNDPPSRQMFETWGAENCMWSNDFPHPNSTWPKSREIIKRDLGQVSDSTLANLVCNNVMRLYGLPPIQPIA